MLGLKHYRDRYELGRSESMTLGRSGRGFTGNSKVLEVAVGTGQNFVSQRILDCGCGEGRFCRLLAARGAAYILGLDLCSLMIEAAEAMKSRCDEYRVADVQKLGFLDSETFDLAVSYLNQCDLPDFHANNREVFRVLKHGGRFIVANLHPLKSAVGGWQKADDGKKLHVILSGHGSPPGFPTSMIMIGISFKLPARGVSKRRQVP